MFTKAQLTEKGKHYFENKEIKVMYATSDGNFFYEHAKSFADSHSKTNKIEVFTIAKEDLNEKKAKTSKSLSDLKKEAKKLGIKGFAIMKEETLKNKIAEANGS